MPVAPPTTETPLHIMHIIAGLQTGGAEHMLLKLASAPRSGLRHTVVSLTDEGPMGPLFRAAGVRVETLEMPRGRLRLGGLLRLYRLLRRERPDVVQTWMYHADLVGGLLARLAGGARVYWNIRHSDLSPADNSLTVRAVAWLCARVSRWVPDRIISCSLVGACRHQALGYVADKFLIIPNGVDGERFMPDAAARRALRVELRLDDATPLLGCIARWDPQKNHQGLLTAWANVLRTHPRARLLLAGQGMDKHNSALEALLAARRLEESVFLLGVRTDMPRVMSALDGLVLPSLHGEGFPNVLVEALACDVPCVATDVGDSAIILNGCGEVIPPGNTEALSLAMLRLLDMPECVRISTACSGRVRVLERYGLERVRDLYATAYRHGRIRDLDATLAPGGMTGPR
jgi:glycosyltransferase involved in cell wall biosynthesis